MSSCNALSTVSFVPFHPKLGEGARHARKGRLRQMGEPKQKYYVDGGNVEIATHLVYELDAAGKQLRVVKFTDYTAEKMRSMCPSAALLRSKWGNAEERAEIIQALEDRGISFEKLAEVAEQPEADPFDLLAKFSLLHGSRTSCGTLGFASVALIFRDDNEMRLWDWVCVLVISSE
jgi:hypothetical protein